MKERAILVTAFFESIKRQSTIADVSSELEELSKAAGLLVVENLSFNQKAPNASLYLGKGRVDEIRVMVKRLRADVVIFECNLSSSQQRNLEEILEVKTIDRTQLILDIFAQRAKSTEGKLQVELAQIKYLLPRLAGQGIYLSRLGGGVGTRGPGEQKLEVDRRRMRERVTRLSKELVELGHRRVASIQKKKESSDPLIAIVGYTNAGKSTLFNRLTQSRVIAKDQLFSTLDTTTRRFLLPGNQKTMLVDTVGFVRDLPHHLVESFKATLEEVSNADLLMHVMDASREDFDFLQKTVSEILKELGAAQKKTILVFNKIDLLSQDKQEALMRQYWQEGVFVSAANNQGIDSLLVRISQSIPGKRIQTEIFIPSQKLGLIGFLYDQAQVLTRRDEPEGTYFQVNISDYSANQLKAQLARPKTS